MKSETKIAIVVGLLSIANVGFSSVTYVNGAARQSALDELDRRVSEKLASLDHRQTITETQYPEILRRLDAMAEMLQRLDDMAQRRR